MSQTVPLDVTGHGQAASLTICPWHFKVHHILLMVVWGTTEFLVPVAFATIREPMFDLPNFHATVCSKN